MPDGRYMLVCVAVHVTLAPLSVQRVENMKIVRDYADDVSIEVIADIVRRSTAKFKGIVISEPGEFYNYPQWRAEIILGRKLRYAESIGERKAIELAHHVSLAVHRMLQEA